MLVVEVKERRDGKEVMIEELNLMLLVVVELVEVEV